MDTTRASTPAPESTVERISDREIVSRRTINGPARIVFEAWTNPDLFRRWWVPKSFPITLVGCELDVRVGGSYKLVFGHGDESSAFFGRYLEVVPASRLVWTNDEGENGQVTTVTFVETGGQTLVTVLDRFPSKEVLDDENASGSTGALPEQLAQLDELIASLDADGAASGS